MCQASREISTSGPSAMAGGNRTTVNKTTTDLRTTTVSRTITDNRTTTVLRTTSFHRTTASSRGSTRTTGRSLTTGSTRTTTDSNRATTGSTTRTRTTGLTRTTKTTASSLDATRCLPSSSRPRALETQVVAAGVFVLIFVVITAIFSAIVLSCHSPSNCCSQVVAVEVPQTLRPASKSSRGGLSRLDLSLSSPDLNLSLR